MPPIQKLHLQREADNDDEVSSLSSMSSFSEAHSKTRDAASAPSINDRSSNSGGATATTTKSTVNSPMPKQRAMKSMAHASLNNNNSVTSSMRSSAPSRSSTHEDPMSSMSSTNTMLTSGGMNMMTGGSMMTRLGGLRGTMPSIQTHSSTLSSSMSTQPVGASMIAGTRRSLGPSTLRSRQPQTMGSLDLGGRHSGGGSQGGSTNGVDPSEHLTRHSMLLNQAGKSSSSALHGYSQQQSGGGGGATPFRPVGGVHRNSGPEVRRRALNDSNSRLGSLTRHNHNGDGGGSSNRRTGSHSESHHELDSSTNASVNRSTLGDVVTRRSVESITLSAHSRDASSTVGGDSQRFYGLNRNANEGPGSRRGSSHTRRLRYGHNGITTEKPSPAGSSSEDVMDSSRLRNRDDSLDDDDGLRDESILEDDHSYDDDDDDGTDESPTEDDPDAFMSDLFNRRTGTGPLVMDKTAVIENSTVWYPNGGQQEDDRPRELGPYGLIIRQIRNGQMEKWQDLESMPVENKNILDDENVAFELERVRLAAQNDMQAILDVATDLWEKTFQKANDLDHMQEEMAELELQLKHYEVNIKTLEDKISANAALWQNKFKSALDELDETEQKLLAQKQQQRIQRGESDIDDEGLTGENMYEAYLENLELVQSLKGEKADLKRSLAEATAQNTVLTENLQDLEDINTKYQSLQSKYSQVSNQFTQSEKLSYLRLQAIDELEERNMTLQELLNERQKDLDELTQHLNDQRGHQMDDDDLGQTMGVCLLKELLNQQSSESQLQTAEQLPPIAEDPEPRELTRVSVSPVVIVNQDEDPKPELTSQKGQPVEMSPTPKEMTIDPNEKGRVDLPPTVKEVVHAVTETVGDIQRVDVQQIGNQIHIHLHQHGHDHHHNHLHNHDHYHSYARTTGTHTTATSTRGTASAVDDRTVAASPLPLAKAEDGEQSSPPKKAVIWSRVKLGQQTEESILKDSKTHSSERPARLQVVGGTKLRPVGFVSERQSVKSLDGKIPVFVNTATSQLEETLRPTMVDENKTATCSTYGTTKVKARFTESNSDGDVNQSQAQESSTPEQRSSSPSNFATMFVDHVQKAKTTTTKEDPEGAPDQHPPQVETTQAS